MPYDSTRHVGRLHRLPAEYYRGFAQVHWSMTIDHRAVGWLDRLHHARIRELLCHALARTGLICPAYCLMPDHGHFLWMGTKPDSDQEAAAKLFRACWNGELEQRAFGLQKQAFDHVLTATERDREGFWTVAEYIFCNPVRAGLAEDWRKYLYLGCVVPGYPILDPREIGYWERFWRIHGSIVGESLTASATRRSATKRSWRNA